MGFTWYELIWFFLIYSFLGWCTEVAYAGMNTGKFVNRGFLNGPVCPIYGTGVVIVVICLTPLQENLAVLFAGSVILTSLLEYVTGFILEKVFHDKWWDYSQVPFNLNGYICLKFSILWGLACVLVMNVIQPLIASLVRHIPNPFGLILMGVLCLAFAADAAVTVASILKWKRAERNLEEVALSLKKISDAIGENIFTGVSVTMERTEDARKELEEKSREFRQSVEEQKAKSRQEWEEKKSRYQAELEEQRSRYQNLLKQKNKVRDRLTRAFPRLKEGRNRELHMRIKDLLEELRKQREEGD